MRDLAGTMEDILGYAKEGAQTVADFMTGTVQGIYYEKQAQKLGLDPSSPHIVDEVDKRLKTLQDLSVEDYMVIGAPEGTGGTGSLGVNAVRKKNQEKALQDMLDFYSRKYSSAKKKK